MNDLVLDTMDDLTMEAEDGGGSAAGSSNARTRHRERPASSSQAIAEAALEACLPRALVRALNRAAPVSAVITVPTVAWAAPIEAALLECWPGARAITETKTPREINAPSSIWTAPLIGVSSDVSWLSPALVDGADHHLRVVVTPKVMRAAMRRVCGRSVPVPARDLAGLDLPDLAQALRPGSPAACIERLRRMVTGRSVPPGRDTTPPLRDVVGADNARDALLAIVDEVERSRTDGTPLVDLPSVLLYGPPGTGKTTLARSTAKSAGMPFIATSVSAWFTDSSGYLDGVAKAAVSFFERARNMAPCVAFLDELDAIPDRAALSARGRDWWLPIITGLLLQIDALRRSEAPVLLIAATNHIGHIDAALKRPGRFDRLIEVLPPATGGELAAVLRQHLGSDLRDVDLTSVAELGLGATGATDEGWVRAARQTAAMERRPITLDDLVAAVLPEDSRTPEEQRRVAVHEAGHAVVARALGFDVGTVSILERGSSGGATNVRGLTATPTRADLERHVSVGLAGRAAEEIILGSASTGAGNDLAVATTHLAAIHVVHGLGDSLVSRASADEIRSLLTLDPLLRKRVHDDLERLMARTRTLVTEHRTEIEALATLLVQRKVVQSGGVGGLGRRPELHSKV